MASTAYLNQAYLAYFGRPIDIDGTRAWAPATEAQVQAAFAASAESQAMYGTTVNLAYINRVYNNLFGRDAEMAGANYWLEMIQLGRVTQAGAAMSILAGALGNDVTVSANRLAATSAFSTAMDTMAENLGYANGLASARAFISSILLTPATQTEVNAAVATATASGGSVTGQTFTLTVGPDTLGTTANNGGNNIFDASGFFNGGTGTFIQTLGNNDSLDGGAGTDTLNVILNTATAITRPAALTSIEVINLTNSVGTNQLDLATATGVTTLNSVNTVTQIADFLNVQSAPTAFGLTNTAVGLRATIANAALAGTTDSATLTLNGVTAGVVTLQTVTPSSGYETLNVVSTGSLANVLTQISQGVSTSLATINVSGATAVNLGATTLEASVVTVNAATATGAVTVTQTSTNTFRFTGGSANDTVIMGGAYTIADIIDGGAGTGDALSITSAIAAGIAVAQTNVTNVEQLTISDPLGAAINTTFFAGVTRINLSADPGDFNITIDSGDEVRFAVATTATPNLVVTGSGTTDTALVTLASGINLTTDALVTTGVETLTINSLGLAGTTNTIFAVTMTNTAAAEALVLTGAAGITITTTTADSVNAAAMTGALTMGATTVAAGGGGVTITGGSAADTLRGSAGSDIINGGAGNDNIRGDAGTDIIDLGAGDDILNWLNLTDGVSMLVSADRDYVTNFTATGTAFTAGSGVDRIDLGNVLTNIDISAGGTVANYQVQAAAGSSTLTTVQGFLELSFEFSSGVNLNSGTAGSLDGTVLLSALGAATGTTAGTITVGANSTDAIIIAYQGGRAFVYTTNNDGNTGIVAAEIGLMGVFEGVAVGGFVFSQFI